MNEQKDRSLTALVLGLVSILTWIIPIAGLPTTILAIVFGAKSLKGEKRTRAIVGLVLGIVFLIFTIVNAVAGAYMGATGQLKFA